MFNENQNFQFLRNYTQHGCEFECAARKGIEICKCLPWYIPNNFTKFEFCDMFGAACFDQIISEKLNYKKCRKICIENCAEISYSLFPTFTPIDYKKFCIDNKIYMKTYLKRYKFTEMYGKYAGIGTLLKNITECEKFVQKFVTMITIDSPTTSVTKSRREKRVNFSGQLATIGGTLGLFSGISILSIVEIFSFGLSLVCTFFRCKRRLLN